MRSGFEMYGAVLVVGLLTWTAQGPAAAPQDRGGGSDVPCAVPLSWRVARVDAEFGLSIEEATDALQRAAGLWEEAVDRRLFVHDPVGGFPVRLVYDQRQARTQERVGRQAEIDEAAARLESRQVELRSRSEFHTEARARYTERLQDLERRVAAHNAIVREWNESGGAPEDVGLELQAIAQEFAAEGRELQAVSRALEVELEGLGDEQAKLIRDTREHNRWVEAAAREFPPAAMEAGVYREVVRKEDGRVMSVSREIRIYRFATEEELQLIAAHEMGHALGLGHSPQAAAVMSEEHGAGDRPIDLARLDPADVGLLRATCPAFGPGRG